MRGIHAPTRKQPPSTPTIPHQHAEKSPHNQHVLSVQHVLFYNPNAARLVARIMNCGRGPLGPRPHLQAVRPAEAGAMQSVVHEMTLVQDLCAAAHQRGQVLVCVVAAKVQLATRRHGRTNPGASAAGVATIRRAQLRLVQYGAFKSLCVHASITHHHPAPRTPVHPGRNRLPARRHNETGERKPSFNMPQQPPKRHPPARSCPGLVNRGKHPRTRATRTVGHKRALTHI